jgi:hypothetical protein
MKKLLILLPLVITFSSCTTVVDTPEPTTTVTRETATHINTSTGYPPVSRSSSTTTIVEP